VALTSWFAMRFDRLGQYTLDQEVLTVDLVERSVGKHWFSDIGDSEPQMMLSTGQTDTENRVG
jgi:hypothetical protein